MNPFADICKWSNSQHGLFFVGQFALGATVYFICSRPDAIFLRATREATRRIFENPNTPDPLPHYSRIGVATYVFGGLVSAALEVVFALLHAGALWNCLSATAIVSRFLKWLVVDAASVFLPACFVWLGVTSAWDMLRPPPRI